MMKCPECECNFVDYALVLSGHGLNANFDEWHCPACFAMLDVWWMVDDLLWYHTSDPLPPFESHKSLVSNVKFNDSQKICCDATMCKCPNELYMPVAKIDTFLDKNNIKPVEHIYDCEDDRIDCRSCELYGRPQCIPFRNWIRYANTYGIHPPKLQLCYEFEEDIEYVQEHKIDINSIYARIEDVLYYSNMSI